MFVAKPWVWGPCEFRPVPRVFRSQGILLGRHQQPPAGELYVLRADPGSPARLPVPQTLPFSVQCNLLVSPPPERQATRCR